MRVFLDTNVIFSGLYSPHGAPSRLLEAANKETIEVVVSQDVLRELTRNIRDKAPHVLTRLNEFLVGTPLDVVPNPPDVEILRWRRAGLESDAAIAAAVAHSDVDYFCTGDKRLIARLRGESLAALIVTPAELDRLLAEGA